MLLPNFLLHNKILPIISFVILVGTYLRKILK